MNVIRTSGGNTSQSGSRFGTIDGLNSQSGGGTSRPPPGGHAGHGHGDDSEDDDEDAPGESWFAGGERRGGRAEASPSRSSAFRGGGHTLGSDEVESSYIADPDAVDEDEVPAIRNLTFWSDGFSLEDGPLMRHDNPENAELLNRLRAGQAPPEFLKLRPGQPVDLRIAQRTNEAYVPPRQGPARAFAGSGNRLGAPVPEFSGAGSSSQSMPGQFPTSQPAQPAAAAERESMTTRFEVDQSLPTTSVQIRLADGTSARPENLTRAYTIGTTFPNRTLDDMNATIEGAGLVNSVVVQRWA
ncbi:hypothetical protein DXG01_005623 [Tephrocybe rancida]|nr:hypothetical protein DXG01_005623 [Tephrocybe rancida]